MMEIRGLFRNAEGTLDRHDSPESVDEEKMIPEEKTRNIHNQASDGHTRFLTYDVREYLI